MTRRAILTVATRNYAHYAQVLMQACQRFHPEADLFICYADRPPAHWEETVSKTHVFYGDQLEIPDWKRFAFQYTPFELSCALKPFATNHVLKLGYDQIAYLDGDMTLYGPLTKAFQALENHSIVLTPHLLTPLPVDGKRPDESAFLASGAYNAGFYAIRNDCSTHGFIEWWQEMCRRQSIVDMAASLFVDQKWLGLVPGLFDGVFILRDPGYNSGHWSLSQFEFREAARNRLSQSGVSIDGQPLVLYHFSGMTPNKPDEYLSSQTRTSLAEIPALARLVVKFHNELASAGMLECTAWGCEYDTLNDGTAIHPAWREAIRRPHMHFANIANPFDALSNPNLVAEFESIQAGAYKWRRDWRLKWPKEQGIAGKVAKTGKNIKGFLRSLKFLRRSA